MEGLPAVQAPQERPPRRRLPHADLSGTARLRRQAPQDQPPRHLPQQLAGTCQDVNWRRLHIRTSLRLAGQDTFWAVGARAHCGASIAVIAVIIAAVATHHLITLWTIAAYPIYLVLAWCGYTIARLRDRSRTNHGDRAGHAARGLSADIRRVWRWSGCQVPGCVRARNPK